MPSYSQVIPYPITPSLTPLHPCHLNPLIPDDVEKPFARFRGVFTLAQLFCYSGPDSPCQAVPLCPPPIAPKSYLFWQKDAGAH